MKTKNILLLLLVISINLFQAQTWRTKQLTEMVSIDFPLESEIKQQGEREFYNLSDSTMIINVMVADMSGMQDFNIQDKDLTNFYKNVIVGRIGSVADARVLDEKEIVIGGYKAVELKYTKDLDKLNDVLVTSNILLIGKTFFVIDFCQLAKDTQKKTLKRFFKSIRIK